MCDEFDPQFIIRHMRRMVREQVRWNVDIDNYIIKHHLVSEIRWPAYCLKFSAEGMDYINDHTEVEA